jgi:Tfp pilus assembly PilM family ATPase
MRLVGDYMATTHDTTDQTADAFGAAKPPSAKVMVRRDRILAPSRRIMVGRTLAFSVTPESVQAALCAHLDKRRRLLDVRKVYIPRDLTTPEQRSQFVSGVLDDLFFELAGRTTTVSLTVEGSETAFRSVQLPDLRGKAFSQALWFEAKRQLPFPINECYFDSRRVIAIETGSNRRIKVSLLGATRRLVAEQLAPFQTLHIPVDVVYHAQDVIGRLLAGLPGFGTDRNYCLVNVERSRTEIAYYRGCELEFSHVISLGSNFLSNRRDDTVYEYFAETLINEIQNSLDYYSGQYTAAFSNQVYLYGDLAYSDDLVDRLAPRFEFSVRRFPVEELQLFQVADETLRSTIAVCLPAVAAAVNNVRLANLLPPENKAVAASRRVDRWINAGVALLICLLGIASFGRYHQTAGHRARLETVTAEVDQFRGSALFATYDSLKQQMASDQAYLSGLKPSPSHSSSLLKELSILTPEEVRLFDLGVTRDQPDRNAHMAGVVHSSGIPPEVILAEFVERLRRSPAFSQVIVDGSQKKKAVDGFDLVFQISFVGVT